MRIPVLISALCHQLKWRHLNGNFAQLLLSDSFSDCAWYVAISVPNGGCYCERICMQSGLKVIPNNTKHFSLCPQVIETNSVSSNWSVVFTQEQPATHVIKVEVEKFVTFFG